MLLEGDGVAEKGDVVIGGKERDQAEGNTTDGLGEPEPVHPEGAEASLGGLRIR